VSSRCPSNEDVALAGFLSAEHLCAIRVFGAVENTKKGALFSSLAAMPISTERTFRGGTFDLVRSNVFLGAYAIAAESLPARVARRGSAEGAFIRQHRHARAALADLIGAIVNEERAILTVRVVRLHRHAGATLALAFPARRIGAAGGEG
jgi:hypothetical protein